jgi:aminocarboxymuconate-semialdehyde decarboxylase
MGRLDHGYRVRPETKTIPQPPSAYVSRFFFDTITHDHALLAYLVARVGSSHVVVGTDRPFDMGIDDPRATVAAIPGLFDNERDDIVGGNARRLLHRFADRLTEAVR